MMIILNKLKCIQHHLFINIKIKLCIYCVHKKIINSINAKLKKKLLGYFNKRLKDKTMLLII